jgi:acyl carrier protein
MSFIIFNLPEYTYMDDAIEIRCARIFRHTAGLENMAEYAKLTDKNLADARFDQFAIDSLAFKEFIMDVETAFSVELDENAVDRCSTIADIAALVVTTPGA